MQPTAGSGITPATAGCVRTAVDEGWRWRARAGLEEYDMGRLPDARRRPFPSPCGHAEAECEAEGGHWVWEERGGEGGG